MDVGDRAVRVVATMPAPSGAASLQYMLDMRHTRLGCLGLRPPLGPNALSQKLAVVTGGTSGIGLAAAKALAAAGATVHICGRSAERGEAAAAAVKDGPGKIIFHQFDLSTVAAASQFEAKLDRALEGRKLDVLVQNLACMPDKFEMIDGHERALSTNLLVFHKLASALHPKLADGARVINVVSAGMHLHKLSVKSLKALDKTPPASYDPIYNYCITHRARVMLTKRWGASASKGIHFCSVHPGWVSTDGLKNAEAMQGFYSLMKGTLRNEDQGADTIAWAAAAENAKHFENGAYLWNRAQRRIDLLFSGTKTSESEVDELEAWLKAGAVS